MPDPAPPLIDAHHHLWDLARRPQPWLDEPAHAPIRRSFTQDDLCAAAAVEDLLQGLSADGQHAVLAGTATDFYRLSTTFPSRGAGCAAD